MAYETIDPIIYNWVTRHSFVLFDNFAGAEARFVYLSSEAGECFQISISPPDEGEIVVSMWCVEGRKHNEKPQSWRATRANLDQVLDDAVDSVVTLTAPSKRYRPN